MSFQYPVTGLISAGLLCYLLYALLHPEKL